MTLCSSPRGPFFFFQTLALASIVNGTSIQAINKNLQYFVILVNNNIIVAMCYLKRIICDIFLNKSVKKSLLSVSTKQ